MARFRLLRSVTLTACVALLVSTAACGGKEDPLSHLDQTPPSMPTASPTLQLTPEEQEAVDEVRETFDRFMSAYVEVATSGEMPHDSPHHSFLDRHSLYTHEYLAELYEMWTQGQRYDGTLTWEFLDVVEVNLDQVTPTGEPDPLVRLRYCVDATGWRKADDATGEPISAPGSRTVWHVPAGYLDESFGAVEGWLLGWRSEEGPC